MAVLQSTNVQGTLCVNGVAVGGGKDFKYCCFTASTTWTPTQDLVDGNGFIDAHLIGAGGGGGGQMVRSCFCGPAQNTRVNPTQGCVGELFAGIVDITATDACTVTVGAGGQGGTANQPTTWTTYDDFEPTYSTTGGNTALGDLIVSGGRAGRDEYRGYRQGIGETYIQCEKTDGQCTGGSTCLDRRFQFGGGCACEDTYNCYDTPNDRPKAGACYGFIGEPNGGVMCGLDTTGVFPGGGTNRGFAYYVFNNPTTICCDKDADQPPCKLGACTYGSAGGHGGCWFTCNFRAGGSTFVTFESGSGGDGYDGIVVLRWQE